MENLILNPKTKIGLEAYQKNPTHALLLSGPVGVGLGTIADELAKTLAGGNTVKIAPKIHGTQKTTNINIDDIRGLNKIANMRSKSALVIVIDEAEQMTRQTPEALLKLLEEPSDNIFFIMTTHTPDKLPATVLSRVQKIEILPTHSESCQDLLKPVKIPAKRRQIEFLANGLPAEIKRLIENEDYFRTKARNFEIAKTFLNSKTYDRLRQISALKTRAEAIEFLSALARLTTILTEKQPSHTNLSLISDVLDNLNQNGNIKAQLTYLATNLQ